MLGTRSVTLRTVSTPRVHFKRYSQGSVGKSISAEMSLRDRIQPKRTGIAPSHRSCWNRYTIPANGHPQEST
ncbi:hypothetical protein TMatcc_002301 [Talaromyces marneffei ATCC 18224]